MVDKDLYISIQTNRLKTKQMPNSVVQNSYLYALSRFFESAGFYGIRGMIVLYLISGTLEMEDFDVAQIYAYFGGALILTQVLGALLGDFAIGSRKASLLGIVMQITGAAILSIPETFGLYIGLGLLVLGSGLYRPNLDAGLGKSLKDDSDQADAGFTLLHFATSAGGFLGTIGLGMAGFNGHFQYTFLIGAALLTFSLVPLLLIKERPALEEPPKKEVQYPKEIIIVAIIMYCVFWGAYDIGYPWIMDLSVNYQEELGSVFSGFASGLLVNTALILSLLAYLVWRVIKLSSYLKILLGYVFAAASFSLFYFMPEQGAGGSFVLVIIGLVLLGAAEVFITPIVRSIVAQNANPKYMAVIFALLYLAYKVLSTVLGFVQEHLFSAPVLAMEIAIGGLIMVGYWYFQLLKGEKTTEN